MPRVPGRNVSLLHLHFLKPLVFISVILGIAPASTVRLLTTPAVLVDADVFLRPVVTSPNPKAPRWSLLYVLVTGIVMNVWNVETFYNTFVHRKRLQSHPTYYYLVIAVCSFLVAPVSVLYIKAYRRKYAETARFSSTVTNVDRKIRSLRSRITYKGNNYRSVILKLILTSVANGILYSVDISAADSDDLVFVVNRIISHLVSTIALLEFCILLDVLRNRFKVVNDIVQEFVSLGVYQVPPRQIITLSILEEVVSQQKARTKKLTNIWDKRQRFSTLKTLRKIHSDLCMLTRDVDAAFRGQLLLEVTSVFLVLMLCGHCIVNGDTKIFSTTNTLFAANMAIWFTYSSVRLLIVIGQCGSVTTEAVRTSELLLSTPMEEQEDDNDAKLGLQVLLFSQQMAHVSSVVRFKAGGVFSLDMHLIVAMLGTVASYLVVLQQIK